MRLHSIIGLSRPATQEELDHLIFGGSKSENGNEEERDHVTKPCGYAVSSMQRPNDPKNSFRS